MALNVSLSLLVLIGATLLQHLSPFVKTAVGAASLCPALIAWFLSLYDKDLKKDFKKEARSFLESRSCTWSLALPAVLIWTLNAHLAGFSSWIQGEPVVLRMVPANGVIQILDGTGAGNGEPIALRLHYRGHAKDYAVKGAGVIYLGQSDLPDVDEKLRKELKEYLVNEGVPQENLERWLTKWGAVQHLAKSTTFRAGDEVGIDLVCKESNKIMVHKPPFHLARHQDPIYLELLEESNPCAPPV